MSLAIAPSLPTSDDAHFDLRLSVSKRWFLLWLIQEYWPDELPEVKLIPFLVKKSMELLRLGFILQLPGEPYPIDEIELFCENGYMTETEKANPGIVYKVTASGTEELGLLRAMDDFETRLGLGPWSELRKKLTDEKE